MFRVEFSVHVTYKNGSTTFDREDQLPFAPFIGLDVLDDMLGEFKLNHVAWHSGSRMFLCQASADRRGWTLRTACRKMAKAGWQEDKESRQRD